MTEPRVPTVCGLDLASQRSGYAILDVDGGLVGCGTLIRAPRASLIVYQAYLAEQIDVITADCLDIWKEDIVVRFAKAAIPIGRVHGAVELGIWRDQRREIGLISPKHAKKIGTGNGNASKDDMVAAATARWGALIAGDEDIADACWVAEAGRLLDLERGVFR